MISVAQMMTPETFQLDVSEPVRDAAAALLVRGLHGAPVVDRSGKLFGVVSQADFLRALLTDQGSGWCVADVATRHPHTAFPEDGVYEAAERMVRTGVHRLPVVDHDGALLGVLTPMDVLRGIVNLGEGFRVRKAPAGEDSR
jgi:CBS domain-containing protein